MKTNIPERFKLGIRFLCPRAQAQTGSVFFLVFQYLNKSSSIHNQQKTPHYKNLILSETARTVSKLYFHVVNVNPEAEVPDSAHLSSMMTLFLLIIKLTDFSHKIYQAIVLEFFSPIARRSHNLDREMLNLELK